MKALFTFIALTIAFATAAQTKFDAEVKKIFDDIPIDSSFEKIVEYAAKNDFWKTPDSPRIWYLHNTKQTEFCGKKLSSSTMHILYADSLYAGRALYLNSFEMFYRMKFSEYEDMEDVYNKLIAQFSKVGKRAELPTQRVWMYTEGYCFFTENLFCPKLIIEKSIYCCGNLVITITYPRISGVPQNISLPQPEYTQLYSPSYRFKF